VSFHGRFTALVGIITIAAALGGALIAGCGVKSEDASAPQSIHGYRVSYQLQSAGAGEVNFDKIEVLSDGDAKVRLTFGEGAEEFTVTDGARAVSVSGDGTSNEEVKVSDVPRFVVHEGDGTLAAWCVDAKVAGNAYVLLRATRHYSCRDPGSESLFKGKELWVDQQTGLILKWIASDLTVTASEIDVDASLPADSFSVQPPQGANDRAHPPVAEFRIPRVGGGELTMDAYRGEPVVILLGDAAGIRALVERVLPMTGGGKSPPVFGLLHSVPPADWTGSLLNSSDVTALARAVSASTGSFQVPVGIDFKGGVSVNMTDPLDPQNAVTAVVLVRSDGTVSRVAAASTTDSELRDWIARLS
jgi:hypothetical protein